MPYNFDQTPDRRPTESLKWNYYEPDVLPMWVADMDFPAPEVIIQALHERVAHGVFGYPIQMPELIESARDWLHQRYAWDVSADDILLLPGVVNGFNLVAHALAEADMAALIQPPVYPPFLRTPANAGLMRQEAELVYTPQGYVIDFDAFEAAITPQTGLFILCNPHNPVGRVFTRQELEKMAAICLEHRVVICSDEIHCDLTFDGFPHIPIASLDAEIAQNTITLMAPSKTFNIAGLHCSLAIVPNRALRQKLQAARRGLVDGVNLLGQVAALAAYQHGQDWLAALLQYLQANRNYLYDYVQRELPGISMIRPEATYLGWLDCRNSRAAADPAKFFLEKARVGLNDGKDFGRGGEGFVRLNFGCSRALLQQILEQMKHALLNAAD